MKKIIVIGIKELVMVIRQQIVGILKILLIMIKKRKVNLIEKYQH